MNDKLQPGDLCLIIGVHRPENEGMIGRAVTLVTFIPKGSNVKVGEFTCYADTGDSWAISGEGIIQIAHNGVIKERDIGIIAQRFLMKINGEPDNSKALVAELKQRGLVCN